MRMLSFLRVEINRIIRSRVTWLFIVLTMSTPLFGFTILKLTYTETASSRMIANPVITGTIGASVLFALFTLFDLDRVNKYKVSMLTDSISSATALHIARMGAIFFVSIVTGFLTILAYFPYTMAGMQSFANPRLYLEFYLIFMIPGMWIGSLIGAISYQISQRMDISLVLVAACVLLNFSGFISRDFILCWLAPYIPILSDGFGNARPIYMGLYNRAFWIMFLVGAWLFSLSFSRKYEKGLFGSMLYNFKKFYLPVTGVIFVLLSINHYKNQPFFNNASIEVDWDALYDTGPRLLCHSVSAEIIPDLDSGTLYGKITYIITSGQSVKKKMIINSGYKIYHISVDGREIAYKDLGDDIHTSKHIEFEIPSGNKMKLYIEYGGYPMTWGAAKPDIGHIDINRNYVELGGSDLTPSLGAAFTAAVTADVILPDHFTLIARHSTVESVTDNGNGTKTWRLLSNDDSFEFFASDYACKIISADEMSVEFYYHKNFADILEKRGIEDVLTDVFDYCTKHFGPLHFLNNNKLILVQTAAVNSGGGADTGLSYMSETTFSIHSLTDPNKGASGKEILAHEIIHQWWGLNRMIMPSEDHPEWSPEGLTVYTTYRLYKEKYGDEYGQKYYVDRWKEEVEKMNRNFYRRHPEYLDIMPKEYAARIRANDLEVAMYSLMPLKIYKAAQLVGGEEAMDLILARLASSNIGSFLTYQEFLDACGLTEEDLELE